MSPTKRWEAIMTKLSQLFCSSPCLKYSLLFLLCLKRMHNLSGFMFLFQHSTGCNTDICIFKYISFFFSFLIHSNLLICNKNQYYIKYWYLYKLFQNWITISTYNSYIILMFIYVTFGIHIWWAFCNNIYKCTMAIHKHSLTMW